MGGVAVILVVVVLGSAGYLFGHKYRVEHGQAGLPMGQVILENIDSVAGTSLAPKVTSATTLT